MKGSLVRVGEDLSCGDHRLYQVLGDVTLQSPGRLDYPRSGTQHAAPEPPWTAGPRQIGGLAEISSWTIYAELTCPHEFHSSFITLLGFLTAAMAVHTSSYESATDNMVDIDRLKSRAGVSQVKEVEPEEKPPVADDYMYDFKYNHALPTSDVLSIEIPADCDAQREAEGIVGRLSEATAQGDAQGFTNLFLESGEFSCLLGLHTDTYLRPTKASGETSSPSPGTTAPSTSDRPFSRLPQTCSRPPRRPISSS